MYHVVVNPSSCSGKGIVLWGSVEEELKKANVEYEVYFSEKSGDIKKRMEELSALPDSEVDVILLGGDGTVNEALQGMNPLSKFVLGYLPTGSSNDLARDLKASFNPAEAIKHIISQDNIINMDIGVVHYEDEELSKKYGDRRFSVSAGIGFDAAICAEAMHSKMKDRLNKIGLGKLTYGGIGIKQVFSAPKSPCKLWLDDSDTPIVFDKIFFIAFMNHKFEGGGFKFCPDADYSDGILDLCTVGAVSIPTFMMALPKAAKGTHFSVKGLAPYKAKKARIHIDTPLWVHTDGEVEAKATDITVTLCEERLKFII